MSQPEHIDGRAMLEAYVAKFKTRKEAAGSLGITSQYLGDLLQARRVLSENMLAKLGLRLTERRVVKA